MIIRSFLNIQEPQCSEINNQQFICYLSYRINGKMTFSLINSRIGIQKMMHREDYILIYHIIDPSTIFIFLSYQFVLSLPICLQQMNIIRIIVLALSLIAFTQCRPQGLALTPPLILIPRTKGCQTDEFQILRQADHLMTSGLSTKGYKYILIESCWQGQRDKNGVMRQDTAKFPSGLPALISELHSRGLLVGLTTDIGTMTACGKSGSRGYEKIDATSYASWGIDYVKIENSQNVSASRQWMTIMSSFIQQTGRRIMISIDNGGKDGVETWGSEIANTWRTTSELSSTWDSLVGGINKQVGLQSYSRSGAWNDVGALLPELPFAEFTSQYLVWVCLKSPITLVNLQGFSQDQLKLLLNPELIAIHQDSLKQQGKLIIKQEFAKGWQQIWGGKISGNRYVLVFLNGMATQAKMQISLKKDVGMPVQSYWVRDPLRQVTVGTSSNDIISVDRVPSHGAEIRVINL